LVEIAYGYGKPPSTAALATYASCSPPDILLSDEVILRAESLMIFTEQWFFVLG